MKIQEQDILNLGKELFGSLKGPQTNLFSKKRWYGNLMKWTLSNPSFKTPLFRFVDVFPSLNKKKDIPFFLNEYFSTAPSSVFKGISILPSSLLSVFISKQMTEMARLFIVGEDLPSILSALKRIRKNNSAFTLDLLGEATLSEKEGNTYQSHYLEIIHQLNSQAQNWNQNPLIDEDEKGDNIPKVNLSVKISSLDSCIFTVAYQDSKNRLKNKLRTLFQKAVDTNTFINIDMEQYKYKNLILDTFKELVSETDFKFYPHFGIVIQAYLKESLKDLQNFSQFTKKHPSPISIRLVKGAYWDYELIHARQNNWPCPVYLNKWESDINFEACTELILNSYPQLRLAIGSHNIRAITHALSLSQKLNIPKKAIEVQTLYGMANDIHAPLTQNGWRIRQYCPIGTSIPGMAYLTRRLLENTANESFLRSWYDQKQNIEAALKAPQKQ